MAKTFETIYQAPNADSTAVVTVNVFKPDKTQDLAQSGPAAQVGTTGRYHHSFAADAPGWFTEISDDKGGKAVKAFGKPEWDSHGIFDLVGDVQTAVATAQASLDALTLALAVTDGKVDGAVVDIAGLASTLSGMDIKLDGLANPPMIG